ncbi:MAG: hypothetical protein KJO21_12120 [Verrucomicrobiae bacterium]|nr:hypothetical protein [Verrucomicrobiae bacterium]NNJ43966.1 hypothetical protein [Akkermansiaceae bacterium]
MIDDTTTQQSPRIYKILLMVLPVGVVVGTVIFMVMYFYLERKEEREHSVIVSHGLRVSDLESMVGKYTDRIGPRVIETDEGRLGLRRAASMIEGGLGPQNVGYLVKKSEGEAAYGLLWKSLSVELRGASEPDEVVLVAVSYAGAGELADAHCVSTLQILASSMARETPARTLRFVFLPMDRSPVEQNQWLTRRCLEAGERCVGIIGLRTMEKPPEIGADDWTVVAPTDADQSWWEYLSEGGPSAGGSEASSPPSVWVTHTVFSPAAWVDQREGRLARTLDVARAIRAWLLKAAR